MTDEQAPPSRSRMAERSEETREALIVEARTLFAQRGFAGVGTEEIVRAARLTRGALYHHFESKEDLFRAVYEVVEQELVEQIAAQSAVATGPLQAPHSRARACL